MIIEVQMRDVATQVTEMEISSLHKAEKVETASKVTNALTLATLTLPWICLYMMW